MKTDSMKSFSSLCRMVCGAVKALVAIAAFALGGANLAFGSPRALVQAFEYGYQPPTWSQEQAASGSDGEWQFDKAGDDAEATGSRSLAMNARIIHKKTGNATRLFSPVVDLSGYTKARLRFYMVNRAKGTNVDALLVAYRKSSDTAWYVLSGGYITTANETWTCYDLELPQLSSTYQVSFTHQDNDGHGVAIDDVEITPVLTSWTDGNGVVWTYYEEDGRAKIYNGVRAPAIAPARTGALTVPSLVNNKPADIEEYALYGCSGLTSVTIQDGVTSIGEYAFSGCTSLASMTIPDSVTRIGDWAFNNTPFYNNQPDGLLVFGSVAYKMKGTCPAAVVIPDGVATIGKQAFYGCGTLTAVDMPRSVTRIEDLAFAQCTSLAEATIPDGVTSIGDNAFANCDALTRVIVPGSAASIGIYAFHDCDALSEVVIKSGVTSIGRNAFFLCSVLADVSIPATVTAIDIGAFSGCEKLKTVHVEAGDAERVKGLLAASGLDVSTVTIVEESADDATWYTTRAEAFAAARRTGKKVFMICGRDTCGNTMYTKNVSCEDPMVKPTLVAKCVLWYTNCDSQQEENYYYWPKDEDYVLPVVCFIDPANEYGYIIRVTGLQWPGNLRSLLTHVPDPVAPDSTINPETIDPMNPGDLPWYKVINARDIWDPVRVSKAVVLRGAAYYGAEVMGIVELKLGKLSKNGTSKVSGTVTTLDGKKHKMKAQSLSVDSTYAGTVNLEVAELGGMDLAVGSIGGVNVFAGSLGKWHVQSAKVGGNWTKANATAAVTVGDLSVFGDGLRDELLPTNEVATVASGKWTFKKGASVKYAKPKSNQATYTPLDAAGKGLVIDTSKDRTNRAGLKLNYTPKKGTFKGSFKVYAVRGGKLTKFTVNVNGVVVDGVGYGEATCKTAPVNWAVRVE